LLVTPHFAFVTLQSDHNTPLFSGLDISDFDSQQEWPLLSSRSLGA